MVKFLITGTFDPPTTGHVDLLIRSSKLCDVVCIAVMDNTSKKTLFSSQERLLLWKTIIDDLADAKLITNSKVELVYSSGLVADVVKNYEVSAIIRGVRNTVDYEYEIQIAEVNYSQNAECETIYFSPRPEMRHISSSIVRELLYRGGDISGYVPSCIRSLVDEYSRNRRKKVFDIQ